MPLLHLPARTLQRTSPLLLRAGAARGLASKAKAGKKSDSKDTAQDGRAQPPPDVLLEVLDPDRLPDVYVGALQSSTRQRLR